MSVVEKLIRGVSGVSGEAGAEAAWGCREVSVVPLCHLRLEALKQIEECLEANRKASAEAGRGQRMANDSRSSAESFFCSSCLGHFTFAPQGGLCWVFASHLVSYPLIIS